jgi:hypothetical protein
VALCQARISTKPLWGFSSSNPYHSQSRAEQVVSRDFFYKVYEIKSVFFCFHIKGFGFLAAIF